MAYELEIVIKQVSTLLTLMKREFEWEKMDVELKKTMEDVRETLTVMKEGMEKMIAEKKEALKGKTEEKEEE